MASSARYSVAPSPGVYSKLRQQKLPAWQPILTAGTVVPSFVLVALLFLPLGIVLHLSSAALTEIPIDYTNCSQGGVPCKDIIGNETGRPGLKSCHCTLQFTVKEDMDGPVFFYYGLSNFYQNHRRYVKSRSDSQLLGENLDAVGDCDPIAEVQESSTQSSTKTLPVAPCGSVANSLFNDTFHIFHKDGDKYKAVNLSYTGVAWPTDRGHKFRNPKVDTGKSLADAFKDTVKPPAWRVGPGYLDNQTLQNNGFENTDFMVWMRTAALPTFRKLWRRLDAPRLLKGTYKVEVEYNYPVQAFGGSKRFIISQASWIGGKNSFLGVAYMVVGSLCLCLAGLFLFIHLKFGKSLTEMSTINAQSRP